MIKIFLMFALAVVVGLLCKLIGLPAGWLLGPLAVSSFFATKHWANIKVPHNLYLLAQALLGVALSSSFTSDTLQLLAHNWFAVFVVVVSMFCIGLLNGWWLIRYRKMDPATAFLGSLPGGAGQMVAVSDDLNADARIVAVMQYSRLLVMMLLISSVARVLLWLHPAAHAHNANLAIYETLPLTVSTFFSQTAISLFLAAIGATLNKFLKVPAGTLMFPALLSVGFSYFTHMTIQCPAVILACAYMIMGIQVGSRFDSHTWPQLASLAAPITASLLILIVGSAFLAWWFIYNLPTDPLTGLLAAAPGSLDSAAAVSIDLNTNGTVVIAVHFLRLALSMLVGPPLVELITGRTRLPD
jgi:membrane AbrB-like protein